MRKNKQNLDKNQQADRTFFGSKTSTDSVVMYTNSMNWTNISWKFLSKNQLSCSSLAARWSEKRMLKSRKTM